jgi:hypothetical protein
MKCIKNFQVRYLRTVFGYSKSSVVIYRILMMDPCFPNMLTGLVSPESSFGNTSD